MFASIRETCRFLGYLLPCILRDIYKPSAQHRIFIVDACDSKFLHVVITEA